MRLTGITFFVTLVEENKQEVTSCCDFLFPSLDDRRDISRRKPDDTVFNILPSALYVNGNTFMKTTLHFCLLFFFFKVNSCRKEFDSLRANFSLKSRPFLIKAFLWREAKEQKVVHLCENG